MIHNLNIKILESYIKIDKLNDEINNELFEFITKANKLVELSDDDYQIERSLRLNKISLKSYVLDSECCIQLNNNNIKNYSIDELKKYLEHYEKIFNDDYSKYFLALSLYECVEKIESLCDEKIDLEVNEISALIPNIGCVKSSETNELENLYYEQKTIIDNLHKISQLETKTYNICIQILNDIFNYYISGYPDIPKEYLYHDDN